MPRTRAIFLAVAALTGLVRCTSFEPSTPAPDAGVAPSPLPEPPVGADQDTGSPPITDAGVDELAPPIDAGPCGHCRSKHCQDGGGCDPLVFVTGVKLAGDLGSVDGGPTGVARADQICMQEAAGPGLFRAWLSDQTTNARTHVTSGNVTTRPLWLASGDRAANSFDELMTKAPLVAINRTANNGQVPNDTHVWTGVNGVGVDTLYHCGRWTNATATAFGHYGLVARSLSWSVSTYEGCNNTGALYCFEIVAP